VIAAGIISLITFLYLAANSYLNSISIEESFRSIINSNAKIVYFLGIIILTILILFFSIKSVNNNYSDEEKLIDKQLFLKIKDEILPSNGSISFLRHHNFRGAFRSDNIEDFRTFIYSIENPEFEFIRKILEKKFKSLKSNISNFMLDLAQNTWNVDNPNIDAKRVPKEWEKEQPERYRNTISKLNNYADTICSEYDQFIKLGIRKLGK
jgi:hypothetical protein